MEFFFFLWLIFCPIFCGIVAANKKRSVAGWVVAGFFLGIFAFIWVLLLPTVQPAASPSTTSTSLTSTAQDTSMRPCPFCAEPIRKEAILCRYCGSRLA